MVFQALLVRRVIIIASQQTAEIFKVLKEKHSKVVTSDKESCWRVSGTLMSTVIQTHIY